MGTFSEVNCINDVFINFLHADAWHFSSRVRAHIAIFLSLCRKTLKDEDPSVMNTLQLRP